MSSAGHVLDMIKRQENNRNLQMQNRYGDRTATRDYGSSKRKFNKEKFSKISPEEIAKNSIRIRSEIRREKLMMYAKTLMVCLCLLLLIFMFL